MKPITALALAAVTAYLAGCAQLEFKLELVDTKTMMESQVLGSYEELGEDLWLTSSVRSAEVEPLPSLEELAERDPERAAALLAYGDSLFLDEELRRLKVQGLVGETAEGYLAATPRLEDDPYAEELIERENENRLRVYRLLTPAPPEAATPAEPVVDPVAETARGYGDRYLAETPPGQWYRDAAGDWRQAR